MRVSWWVAAVLAGAMAMTAQYASADPCPASIGTVTTTPFSCDVQKTGSGLFLDTVNFDVAPSHQIVTITSVVDNIQFFSLPVFENSGDTEYVADGGGDDPDGAGQHIGVDLAQYAKPGPGYHVHPQGLKNGTGSYQLTFVAAAPAINVTPTSGLTTSEAGATAQFQVSLNTAAQAPVSIPVTSNNVNEGAVSPAQVSFAAGERGPVTVTITGVDDTLVDGNQPYTIALGAAQTTDTRFAGLDPDDVSVTNVDLDGNVQVSALSGQVTEAGGQGSFTVRLASAPAGDVTIMLAVDKPGEAQVNPASLTFTPADGTSPQAVTVTGQDDVLTDGDQAFTVTLGPAASTDPNFNGITTTVSGQNKDDDIPGIVVQPTAGLVTDEQGGAATITVRLATTPAADVLIFMSVSDSTEADVTPSQLTFTAANATTPQTVTLTGKPDGNVDGDVTYQLQFAPAVSSDPNYQGLGAPPVGVVNVDADASQSAATSGNFGGCSLVAGQDMSPASWLEWGLLLGGLAVSWLPARPRMRRFAAFHRGVTRS